MMTLISGDMFLRAVRSIRVNTALPRRDNSLPPSPVSYPLSCLHSCPSSCLQTFPLARLPTNTLARWIPYPRHARPTASFFLLPRGLPHYLPPTCLTFTA